MLKATLPGGKRKCNGIEITKDACTIFDDKLIITNEEYNFYFMMKLLEER